MAAKEFPRYLVTSALPYANGRIHIGHIAGAYLPADICVRFLRLIGREAAYICGSDEHGVPITITAEQEGVTPQEIIDRYHAANEKAFRALGISFDLYGRTSWPLHHELTQEFFKKLDAAGHIEKKEMEQQHCPKCHRFLPDRYVEGRCPKCNAAGARGDQCDACTRSLSALELREPHCKICGTSAEVRPTTHWFLKLGDFQKKLGEWLDAHPEWRENVRQGARGWLREGLRSRAITRDLDWGVPLPLEDPDAEGKVLYVWFDAPIGYLTNTVQWARDQKKPEDWKRWWQSEECAVIHFIGKDNIPFHAITWPAMLMGVGEYSLPQEVVANEYLNFQGGKFSKSKGNLIAVEDILRQFPPDPLRYYLTAVAPESSDADFTWEDFQARVNSELADILGNFVHRSLSFAAKYFDGKIPEAGKPAAEDEALHAELRATRDEMRELMLRHRYHAALERMMRAGGAANRHFDKCAPWASRKTDMDACACTIRCALEATAALGALMRPFMPAAAARLESIFGPAGKGMKSLRGEPGSWDLIAEERLPAGELLGKAKILFEKYDDERIAAAAAALGG